MLTLALTFSGTSAVYNQTIVQILQSQVPDFATSLSTNAPALFDELNTTAECPCNVFQEYGLSMVPVFTGAAVSCLNITNSSEQAECLVQNVCEPYRTLAGNGCGGLFNASIPASLRNTLNSLTGLCSTLNVTVVINTSCTEAQVVDYTVFAVDGISNIPQNVLQYHVIRRSFSRSQLPANTTTYVNSAYTPVGGNPQILSVTTSGNGQDIDVRVISDFATGVMQNVTYTGVGSNGNVHLLTGALGLPQNTSATVDAIPELSSLLSVVTALNLGGALDSKGNLTLLAPTNAAFAAYPLLRMLSAPAQTDLLLSHGIEATVLSTMLVNQTVVETLSLKLNLTVDISDSGVKFVATHNNRDYTMVVRTNIVTSNGVIHVVDAVLRQQDQTTYNVVENLILDSRLDAFAADIEANATAYLDHVENLVECTVFAPTTQASLADLENPEFNASVYYALLDVKVNAGDLANGANIVASQLNDPNFVRLGGAAQKLVVNAGSEGVFVQWGWPPSEQVQVVVANLEGSNGVIHITNGNIMVPEFSTATIKRGGYTELFMRLTNNSDFANEINGLDEKELNFTFFVAANKFWSDLSSEFNDTEKIMRDQLIRGGEEGPLFSTNIMAKFPLVPNGTSSFNVTMDGGDTYLVENRTDGIYVGGLKVLQVNIPTANGVIHVLDGVLGQSSSSSGLSAGVLAAIIVGGVAFLGLLCYCFFMRQEESSQEENQPFARIKD